MLGKTLQPFNQARYPTLMTEKGTLRSVKQLWSWSIDALLLHFFKESLASWIKEGIADHLDACVDDSLEELMVGMELRDDESE